MFGMIRIRKHERGVWLRYGDFKGILRPGRLRFWSRLWSGARNEVQVFSVLTPKFEHKLLDLIAADERARDELLIVDLNDAQRALVWKDDRILALLGPGRHAFWRAAGDLYVETFDVSEARFDHARVAAVLQHPDATKHLDGLRIEPFGEALVYRDGRFVGKLAEGLHVFWKDNGLLTRRIVDRREQVADVAGQEIMTRDKVSLRVNLLVTYRVADAELAATAVSDYAQALYREAQLALRAAVGTRALDALLADKESIGGEVRDVLAQRAAEFGVAVISVGLRDIILPGDMKSILNQVIAAEKQAEANLIKRREETAAARSQANTAKLLAENPLLARMKELELLGEILSGSKATFVFGGGDIAEQVRSLVRQSGTAPADG